MAGLFGFFRKKDKQQLPVTQDDQNPDTDQQGVAADESSAQPDQNAAAPAAEPAQESDDLRDNLHKQRAEAMQQEESRRFAEPSPTQPTPGAALSQQITEAAPEKIPDSTQPHDVAQSAAQQAESSPPAQIHVHAAGKTAATQPGTRRAAGKLSDPDSQPGEAGPGKHRIQPADIQEVMEDAGSTQPAEPLAKPEPAPAGQPQEQDMVSAAGDNSAAVDEASAPGGEPRASFFDRLRRTRENLAVGLSSFMKGRNIDLDLYDELETSLLTADLGVDTTALVIDRLRREARLRELHDASLLKNRLAEILCDILRPCEVPLEIGDAQAPYVILMVGVNGSGKTTTIGKLAYIYQQQGHKVMLAAGDTFRAAAVEQLKTWGERSGIPVIAQQTGSDSASVIFDALSAARTRAMDLLICDTAGRLQNKEHLMKELEKIVRVMKKNNPDVPHETMLVLDGTTGQNAVSQTRLFSSAVPVTGLCLTKLDGTAKGGVVFALADKFRIPIRYIGIGEKATDLREFKAREFVRALIEEA